MYYLIYSSYTTVKFDDDSLKSLLVQSREKNRSLGITGMLLYFDDKFIQLIEGDVTMVEQLYADIEQDVRHKDLVVLRDGDIEERFFSDWTMGFKAISAHEIANEDGFKDLRSSDALNYETVFKLFQILSLKTE